MLKYAYDLQEDIPEKFRELYEEKNGRFVLAKIEGVRTIDDIAKLKTALEKEREEHASSRRRVKETFGDMSLEEIKDLLSNPKKQDPVDIDNILSQKLTPLQKERDKLLKQMQEAQEKLIAYETQSKQRAIRDTVIDAARRGKVVDTAIDDIALLAERVFDVTDDGSVLSRDGMRAEEWLSDMKNKRPHWWPVSMGGGATGSGIGGYAQAVNPWTAKDWNLMDQARILQENRGAAQRLASQAGTTVGGLKPKE